MNIFEALRITHQSYVSNLGQMISDNQVAAHALAGARDDAAKTMQAELDNIVEFLSKQTAVRIAAMNDAYNRQIAALDEQTAKLAHMREIIDAGRIVPQQLEPLSEEEARIIPKIAPRDHDAPMPEA